MDKCIQCGVENHITGNDGGLFWCTMTCKKKFLLDNFSLQQAKTWFAENDDQRKADRVKILKLIKKSGMTITEYIDFLNSS